jgi:3-methyladenine DNA glycosylase AlkD
MPATSAVQIEAELAALADPAHAEVMRRFFKTGPGGYGEGDVFIGIRVPELRRVARAHRTASVETCRRLLESEIHEHRFVALAILCLQYERADATERERLADFYLEHRDRANNWDLVDASAPYLLADRVTRAPRRLLDPLVRSRVVWDRRIAVLATFALIRRGSFEQTLRVCEALLRDTHDLIHKATGWMLREVGKRDEAVLRGFLDRHAGAMPRTMLRYSIERLPDADRRAYMAVGRR